MSARFPDRLFFRIKIQQPGVRGVFAPDQYQLIDFGRGRKLERFGSLLIDRPCPAADGLSPLLPDRWTGAHARYQRSSNRDGQWLPPGALPDTWIVRHEGLVLELRPTPFGHLGIFPEQAENWDWLSEHLRTAGARPRVLNLFAYTGGSTLVAAAAGAEVVHVDAAKNIVDWARRNAELSALGDASIRWISEDAATFVRRERKRGASYNAVILDPPSYGHGPKGQVWKIEQHLESLLTACGELMQAGPRLVLLTCHTTSFTPVGLRQILRTTCLRDRNDRIETRPLTLCTKTGRHLPSGLVARWASDPHRPPTTDH